jgi:predicted dehydrogenase
MSRRHRGNGGAGPEWQAVMDEGPLSSTRLGRRALLGQIGAAASASLANAAHAFDEPMTARIPGSLRVGIIGLDGHVSEVTDAVRTVPGLRVTAVAESKPELRRPAERNSAFRGAQFYDDPRALLDGEKLDVVAVCGETGGRAAILQACAERKLPIVAEKPLTATLEELRAVRAAVRKHRVPLTMLLPMRFSPHYFQMWKLVRSGAIGDVIGMDAQKSYKLGERPEWMKHRERLGGTIPYVGIHMVDLMLWIGGRPFTETAAFHGRAGFPEIGEMENTAAVLFRMDHCGTASLQIDYLRPAAAPTHGDDRLRIAGSRGMIEYQAATGLTLITGSEKPRTITDLPPERSLFVDFLESLYGGKPHLIRPEEVFHGTEVVLRAREAADTGRVVRL